MTLFVQGVKEGDGLDGLTQTHFVGQNDVRSVTPTMTCPRNTFKENIGIIRKKSENNQKILENLDIFGKNLENFGKNWKYSEKN